MNTITNKIVSKKNDIRSAKEEITPLVLKQIEQVPSGDVKCAVAYKLVAIREYIPPSERMDYCLEDPSGHMFVYIAKDESAALGDLDLSVCLSTSQRTFRDFSLTFRVETTKDGKHTTFPMQIFVLRNLAPVIFEYRDVPDVTGKLVRECAITNIVKQFPAKRSTSWNLGLLDKGVVYKVTGVLPHLFDGKEHYFIQIENVVPIFYSNIHFENEFRKEVIYEPFKIKLYRHEDELKVKFISDFDTN